MAQPLPFGVKNHQRRNWVPLRTLVWLRWIAIAGQICAVLMAVYGFGISLAVGPISCAIGASVILNLVSATLTPRNRRLTEREAMMMIGFDILQLGVLLILSGGLNNPFALLILAPVTVASTVLPLRSTVILGLITVILVTVMGVVNLPIRLPDGNTLSLSDISVFGTWVALLIGLFFLTVYARQVTSDTTSMSEALVATQMALSREQALTDLGGVVAAAAHELGTPLATIKLVSTELMDELSEQPEQRGDVELIAAQVDRCRDILRSMGRAGKEDLLIRQAPLETVIKDASDPHLNRGKNVTFELHPPQDGPADQPMIHRRPEMIHGLRNLIQNAVDFAHSSVVVTISWTENGIDIGITDDGPGFSHSVLDRIGDPFVRRRRAGGNPDRPGYDGMGLGLFIAKTLLERTGAELTFANGRVNAREYAHRGAIVHVKWPRATIETVRPAQQRGLGKNEPFSTI